MEYVKKNVNAIYGGALAVGLGLLGKMMFKKEVILPASNFKQAIITFAAVTAVGVGGNQINLYYPQKI